MTVVLCQDRPTQESSCRVLEEGSDRYTYKFRLIRPGRDRGRPQQGALCQTGDAMQGQTRDGRGRGAKTTKHTTQTRIGRGRRCMYYLSIRRKANKRHNGEKRAREGQRPGATDGELVHFFLVLSLLLLSLGLLAAPLSGLPPPGGHSQNICRNFPTSLPSLLRIFSFSGSTLDNCDY